MAEYGDGIVYFAVSVFSTDAYSPNLTLFFNFSLLYVIAA